MMWMRLNNVDNRYRHASPDDGMTVNEGVDSDQWGDLVGDEDPGEGSEELEASAPAAEVEEGWEPEGEKAKPAAAEAAPAPAAEEPPTPAPTAQPEPSPQQPQMATQQEPPQPRATDEVRQGPQDYPQQARQPQRQQITPEQRQALLAEAKRQLTQRYAMSPEVLERFDSEPDKVLQDLAANIHMQVYNEVSRTLLHQVPQLVRHQMTSTQQGNAATNAFYERWPELKAHEADVARFGQMWRGMNPQADMGTAIEEIGKHMSIALGLPLEGRREEPAAPPTPPPHVPAGKSAVTEPPPRPTKSDNPWTSFSEDLDEDY